MNKVQIEIVLLWAKPKPIIYDGRGSVSNLSGKSGGSMVSYTCLSKT